VVDIVRLALQQQQKKVAIIDQTTKVFRIFLAFFGGRYVMCVTVTVHSLVLTILLVSMRLVLLFWAE